MPGDHLTQVGDLVCYHFWRDGIWHTDGSLLIVVCREGLMATVLTPDRTLMRVPVSLLTRM
jgi:hypothetical protein